MSSATLDALLDCASASHGVAPCQRMQSPATTPFSGALDLTCPLLSGSSWSDTPAAATAVAQRSAASAQSAVRLAMAALLVLDAALVLCLLQRRRQLAATAAGAAAAPPAAAATTCRPCEADYATPNKQTVKNDEPRASRCAPAVLQMTFVAWTVHVDQDAMSAPSAHRNSGEHSRCSQSADSQRSLGPRAAASRDHQASPAASQRSGHRQACRLSLCEPLHQLPRHTDCSNGCSHAESGMLSTS